MFRFIATTCSALFMALFLVPTISCEAANLHAIIVADTSDGNDAIARVFDLTNMSNEMHQIANYTGMTLNEKTFYGSDVEIDKIYKALNDLEVGPDDAVVLYMNMSGFRDLLKENNEFPYLSFPYTNEGIDSSDFYAVAQQKHPRLFVSITEASNYFVEVNSVPMVNKKFFWNSNDDDLKSKNYQKLFLESHGEILISSTAPGGYGYYYNSKGFVYSTVFLDKLQEAVKSDVPVDWSTLLKKISTSVQKTMNDQGVVQHPYYVIDLKE